MCNLPPLPPAIFWVESSFLDPVLRFQKGGPSVFEKKKKDSLVGLWEISKGSLYASLREEERVREDLFHSRKCERKERELD